jgi:hypothetical protein
MMRGGAVGSPRWTRRWWIVDGSVMKAMILILTPLSGHSSGNASWMRASSSAQAWRAARRSSNFSGVRICGPVLPGPVLALS